MAAIIHSPAMMGIPENAAISFRSSKTGPFDSELLNTFLALYHRN